MKRFFDPSEMRIYEGHANVCIAGGAPGGSSSAAHRLRHLSGIQFGMFSGAQMTRAASLAIMSRELYRMPPHREAAPYGVLDHRLGVSSKTEACGTCNRSLAECPGHWGVIVLELPVNLAGDLRLETVSLKDRCFLVLVHLLDGERTRVPSCELCFR
jgi:hypothetical protein